MHTGMLWFDNSQATLPVKIQKAVDYYFKKYGRQPDLCFVPMGALEKVQARVEIGNLTIRPSRFVLPSHIWIGIEDKA